MRVTLASILTASAALALTGAAAAQSPYGYYVPAPQYAPPQAPHWSVAYDPFFTQPMWGYGYGYQQPAPTWPTAYAGAPMQARPTAYAGVPTRAPRARATRARYPSSSLFDDPFFTQPFFANSLFDDPFFTEPWGFGAWPSSFGGSGRVAAPRGRVAGAGVPMRGWAGAGVPSMLGYGSFGTDDFWDWARFGDFADSGWAGSSASAYSYTARNSNGQCVRVVRETRNGQTVSQRENCGAVAPGADVYDDFDDFED